MDEKILCMHGGLSPELLNMEQIKRIMRPTGKSNTAALSCHQACALTMLLFVL